MYLKIAWGSIYYTHTHTHICTHTHTHMHTHKCTHTHTCTHTNAHTHTHSDSAQGNVLETTALYVFGHVHMFQPVSHIGLVTSKSIHGLVP
jgi:IS5 family transposase